MVILLDRDQNDLLLKSEGKTILKAKSIAQEIFDEYQQRIEDGLLQVTLIADEDDPQILVDNEEEADSESTLHLVQSLMIDIEEQELADLEVYDLLLEIKSDGAKVHQIGLFEVDPDAVEEEEDDPEVEEPEYVNDIN